MASQISKPAKAAGSVTKLPRSMKIFALDPESGEREKLGEWLVNERWQIVKISGIGHYQEMLEEIAEELNELDELEFSDSATQLSQGAQAEPDWVDRASPNFGRAVANFLRDQFDLECQ